MHAVCCAAAAPVASIQRRLQHVHADPLSQLGRQQKAKIGVGVSPEAQAIFLALPKTMTFHSDGLAINVLKEVSSRLTPTLPRPPP